MINVGDRVSLERTISADDVVAFAYMSRDHNPLHVDAQYSAAGPFGKPCAHGMLALALVSGALTKLCGDGNLWLDTKVEFRRPVFVDDTLICTAWVTDIDHRRVAQVHYEVWRNQSTEPALVGHARCIRSV